jgi:hypothetical protein
VRACLCVCVPTHQSICKFQPVFLLFFTALVVYLLSRCRAGFVESNSVLAPVIIDTVETYNDMKGFRIPSYRNPSSDRYFFFLSPRSVGIALGYGLDCRGSRFRFPAGAGDFSLHQCVQNGSGTHSASYPMGKRGSFPGSKAAGA